MISGWMLALGGLHAQQRTLDYYIGEGLSASPLLKDLSNQVSSNAADSALLRATYRPQVTASSTNSYAPIIRGWGYDEAISNGRNINGVVGISQVIAGKDNINIRVNAYTLAALGLQNKKDISEQDLKKAITTQYITAYGDEQQLDFLQEVYAQLQEEDTLLKKLTSGNVYRQTDYLTFLVTLQQQELAIKQGDIRLKNDLATLNYLAGIIDTGYVRLSQPALTINEQPAATHSIFFRQFQLDSLGILNRRKLTDLNYRPRLSWFGDAGYNSTWTTEGYKNFGFSFGFSLSVPIYDGRQRRIQYRKLSIEEDTRKNYEDFYHRQYQQQVLQLHQQLDAIQSLMPDLEHQVRYTDALIKANSRLLASGDVKIADMVIAVNNLLAVKNQITQNQVARLELINQINYWSR